MQSQCHDMYVAYSLFTQVATLTYPPSLEFWNFVPDGWALGLTREEGSGLLIFQLMHSMSGL